MNRLAVTAFALVLALAPDPLSAADTVPTDVQMPGTQPLEISNLESPDKCDNCHGGYNSAVEPAHNWRGSMMSHAGRDPIFWATLAIAEQDFDGAGDLCLRCHSTAGWLAGRSTPTDGSGLAAGDSDGVECDYCHKLTNPDDSEHLGVMNAPFVANDGGSPAEGYYGSGMSSLWSGSDKLGPYVDADARHQFMQSQFHRDRNFCGTCHDVSNPVTGELAHNAGQLADASGVTRDGTPGNPVNGKAAFNNPPYLYGIVERTFSEYRSGAISETRVDDYPALPEELRGGALQAIYEATYIPSRGTANYEDGATRYYSCQSCHMRAVTGTGANKRGVPVRTDLPLHDMTGGNYWMPEAIAWLDERGLLRLGGGMSPSHKQAMLDGALRAREQLQLAASLRVEGNEVYIVNHTGHKLITGYPEGRRMWLNVRWYDENGQLFHEDGAYGPIDVLIDGTTVQVNSLLDLHPDPAVDNTKIYEAHMGMTAEWAGQLIGLGYDSGLPLAYDRLTEAVTLTLGDLAAMPPGSVRETFHFVLNNAVVEDNRIPPYGMDKQEALRRNAAPVPDDQYGGGEHAIYEHYDEISLNPPAGAVSAEIRLMYQPTSWEYIQFLDLANTGQNAFLGNEGQNMLDAWRATGMAEPVVMASTNWGTPPPTCELVAPALDSAVSQDKSVDLAWTGPVSAEYDYHLYYDQSGKAQAVATLDCATEPCTAHTDTGLTNGQEYCYKVTLAEGACESAFSNILCATPRAPGQQQFVAATISEIGRWVKQGKGKTATTVFEPTSTFAQGDAVVIRLRVTDANGNPVAGATVNLAVTGAESASLVSSSSNAGGEAEATWQTQQPNRKGQGGTAQGSYVATVTVVNAPGQTWDGNAPSVGFTIGLAAGRVHGHH